MPELQPLYAGAWPAMVTPYDTAMKIDVGVYRSLVKWYLHHHAGGLYANCLTSEMYQLTLEERQLLTSEAAVIAGGRVPVASTGNAGAVWAARDLAGAFGSAWGGVVRTSVEECRQIAGAGADVVMLVVPPWCKTDAELEAYLMAVAEQVPARLGIYECPVPRPYHLGVDLVRRLAHTGRFYAYKETSCQLEKIRALVAAVKGTPLALLQANTPYLLEAIRAGAPGTMSIAAAWLPDLVDRVIRSAQAGRPEAEGLQAELATFELAQRSVHPRGTKYLLGKRGVPITPRSKAGGNELSPEELQALDYLALRVSSSKAITFKVSVSESST